MRLQRPAATVAARYYRVPCWTARRRKGVRSQGPARRRGCPLRYRGRCCFAAAGGCGRDAGVGGAGGGRMPVRMPQGSGGSPCRWSPRVERGRGRGAWPLPPSAGGAATAPAPSPSPVGGAARGGRRSPPAQRHEGAVSARHLAAAGLPPPRRLLRPPPLGHAVLLHGGQRLRVAGQLRAAAAPPAARQPLAAALPPAVARRPAPAPTRLAAAAAGPLPRALPAAR